MKFKDQIFVLAALFVASVGYAQIPEAYKGKTAVFVPTDNKTYFMSATKESISPASNYQVEFVGVVGEMVGDKTAEVLAGEADAKPVWKWDMSRIVINRPTRHVECKAGGVVCIILIHVNDPGYTDPY